MIGLTKVLPAPTISELTVGAGELGFDVQPTDNARPQRKSTALSETELLIFAFYCSFPEEEQSRSIRLSGPGLTP